MHLTDPNRPNPTPQPITYVVGGHGQSFLKDTSEKLRASPLQRIPVACMSLLWTILRMTSPEKRVCCCTSSLACMCVRVYLCVIKRVRAWHACCACVRACMCMCICMCVHMNVCVCASVHAYVAHAWARMRVCERACVRVCVCASLRVCECACVRAYVCVSVRVCACADMLEQA